MRSIRKGTFETNSSSCHSMTFTTTNNSVDEFNEGKRIYADLRYSTIHESKGEGFHTFQDVADALMETLGSDKYANIENDDVISSLYDAEYIIGDNSWEKRYIEDLENLKEWMSVNFNAEMMEWAFTNKKDPKMFPIKSIIRNFIRAWADKVYIGPLLTIYDFDGGNCGSAYFYKMDYSDVYWDNENNKFALYDNESDNVNLRFDFRDS